jgi:heme exporter protein B
MNFASKVWHYMLLELKLEYRLKFALAALLMYVLSTVYLVYFSIEYQGMKEDLLPTIWSIFFWLIVLFTTVNATFRSFAKESEARMFFYYNLVSAPVFITAKILVNAFISLALSLITSIIFTAILGNPSQNFWVFFLALSVGTVGYSFLFTYVSAIAAKAGSNASLAVILGFPLALPLLTIIVKLFGEAFKPEIGTNFDNNLLIALGFNFLPFLLALILFPYIWRD